MTAGKATPKQRLATETERLKALGLIPWLMPRGGFFLWCHLPEGQDSTAIAQRCMADNIVLAPGNVFSLPQTATPCMRFNVAQMADAPIYAAIEQAIERRGQA